MRTLLLVKVLGLCLVSATGFSLHAQDMHRKIYKNPSAQFKVMSDAAECAVRLIEKKYSRDSVLMGGVFLNQILHKAKRKDLPSLREIIKTCQDYSGSIVQKDDFKPQMFLSDKNFSEAIAQAETDSPYQRGLGSYIARNLNAKTHCVKSAFSIKAGFLFGVQVGAGVAKCQTPFGRRFLLRGPFAGGAVNGGGAGVFLERFELDISPRSSYRYADAHFAVLEGALGIGARMKDYEDDLREELDEVLSEGEKQVTPIFGAGVYFAAGEFNFNLCKQTRIKPNFVPLFEHFGIDIPL